MRKNIKIIILALVFIMMDQAIKIYIYRNLMHKEYDILSNFVAFKPYINIKYSWFNSISNFNIGLLPHIIVGLLILLGTFLAYGFVKKKYTMYPFTSCLFAFLFAGAFCSLIDKIAWGGSLDYIHLKGFFIFDLKDVYLSAFEVMIVIAVIINYKGLRNLKEKALAKDFKDYMKCLLQRS